MKADIAAKRQVRSLDRSDRARRRGRLCVLNPAPPSQAEKAEREEREKRRQQNELKGTTYSEVRPRRSRQRGARADEASSFPAAQKSGQAEDDEQEAAAPGQTQVTKQGEVELASVYADDTKRGRPKGLGR